MEKKESLSSSVRSIAKETMVGTVKSVFGMVPVIGTMLDELVFEIGSRVRADRVEQFCQALAEKIEKLDENAIDKEYLKSEECHDLLLDTMQRVTKTRSQEKLEAFAKILTRAIVDKEKTDLSDASIFIRYVDELSTTHLCIFSDLIRHEAAFNEEMTPQTWDQLHAKYEDITKTQIDKYKFRLCCGDLVSRMLIIFKPELKELDFGGAYTINSSRPFSCTLFGQRFRDYIIQSQ